MRIRFLALSLLAPFFMSSIAVAGNQSNYGASLSIATQAMNTIPEYLHGYRAAVWYQPTSLIWNHTHILFDGSFGHWWVSNNTPHQSLSILSVSPILRYYFFNDRYFSPFINLSIGAAFLTKTRIGKRNLGMHFAFQDQGGIGATFGTAQKLSLIISAIHYSNGRLCSRNSGFTVPIVATLEYGF